MFRLQIPLTKENEIELADICLANAFIKRGKAFFRVHGDGVFQTVKFEYERVFEHHQLRIGIQSMYSNLEPQHFTSGGCIPHYYVFAPTGKHDAVNHTISEDGMMHVTIDSPDQQIAFLRTSCMSWLESITTQEILAETLYTLEPTRWNNWERIAPYLACQNYDGAEHVISAILHQHGCAWGGFSWNDSPWNLQPWTHDIYEKYYALFSNVDEDLKFLQIHDWIYHKDTKAINDYLQANYARNCQSAKWMKKSKTGDGLREPF